LGRHVLEIGSGNGAVAAEITRTNDGVSVTATDLDPAMVAAARTRLGPLQNVDVAQVDATELPFPDESFDSVVSCLMLHHVIEWERCLREIARVLKPGGWLLGYDLVRTPLAKMVHRVDRSPFHLINPDDFQKGCADVDLSAEVHTRLAGHIMQFAAEKSR
jgi:ubiquinone/menaquinone biosynthesis C-methylase UbiE